MCQRSEWAGRMSSEPQGRVRFCGFRASRASSWKGRKSAAVTSCQHPGRKVWYNQDCEEGKNIEVEKRKNKRAGRGRGFVALVKGSLCVNGGWQRAGTSWGLAAQRQVAGGR